MTVADGVEAAEVRAALQRLRRGTGLEVAFGGLVDDASCVRIAELNGTATRSLSGLAIRAGNGLGGKAVALARPCTVTDYSTSRQISHEYDAVVAPEGLRAVLAVPLVVRRRVRGLLYGALRTALPLGDRTLAAAGAAARDVEQALVVRDEAAALVAAAREAASGLPPGRGSGLPPGHSGAWEQVREAREALRALAPRIGDPALREELLAECARLMSATPTSATPTSATPMTATPMTAIPAPAPAAMSTAPRLAPRELDVLVCLTDGVTNAVVAERLGLRPETVKSYLRSAMRKLGARTRWEAVVVARRSGVLP
ncbi:helix-turn-helix transcriptional regulator [Streptomyces silvensis]|uniref:Helix-turn-helix transcriptional regulator n=1 Tax=Streptomyces silvensis TaxID=1765722 RepID=A0A0W7X0V2_9ACTN|nr:helix-turn-helix transcriptional regulator [Streptomyces silvensis]KUF16452.1 helix-turn-helix transcriptional regulator [Streptomyces silvensis]